MTTPTPTNRLNPVGTDPITMNVAQVAAETGLSTDVIYDQINAGELTGRRFGRRILILRSDFIAWLESRPIVGGAA